MGTGVGGVSLPVCAHGMVDTTIDALLDAEKIRRVVFVLVDEPGRKAFHDELLRRFSRK